MASKGVKIRMKHEKLTFCGLGKSQLFGNIVDSRLSNHSRQQRVAPNKLALTPIELGFFLLQSSHLHLHVSVPSPPVFPLPVRFLTPLLCWPTTLTYEQIKRLCGQTLHARGLCFSSCHRKQKIHSFRLIFSICKLTNQWGCHYIVWMKGLQQIVALGAEKSLFVI